VVSYVALVVINKATPVRASEKEEEMGLDDALHGEEAYVGDV
jgi:Amt family ammonium transporter